MTAQGSAPHAMRNRTESKWWSRTEYGHFARYDDEVHTPAWEGVAWRWQSKSAFHPVVFVFEVPGEENE